MMLPVRFRRFTETIEQNLCDKAVQNSSIKDNVVFAVELKQLKYFITVIETGSLGKAAKNLDIGTSALSQQISKLESELSIRLLQRTALGTVPTPAGLALSVTCKI